MPQETKDRILGAFYGQALGDAFGMPSELWPRSRVIQHFGWIDSFLDGPQENDAAKYFKAAEFTDDTSMAIALADSIIECGGRVDTTVIAGRILAWAESFDAFNKNVLGPTSKVALMAIKAGQPVADLPNLGMTNGAAMRVMPMGCLLPTASFDDFYAEIAAACAPTHKSDVAIAGAVVIAWAISKAVDGQAWLGRCAYSARRGAASAAQEREHIQCKSWRARRTGLVSCQRRTRRQRSFSTDLRSRWRGYLCH